MVAPAASDVDGVVQWLAARGYSTVQRHGDALTVSKKKEGAKADPDQASSVTNQVDDENRTPTTSGGGLQPTCGLRLAHLQECRRGTL